MTISYDWYTSNYRHAAVYAKLIVKTTIYNKPFTFNWSEKIGGLYFLKFPGQFHVFRNAGYKVSKSGTVPANPGRMACMSHTVFCSIKEKMVILARLTLLSANTFNLVTSKNLLFGKG